VLLHPPALAFWLQRELRRDVSPKPLRREPFPLSSGPFNRSGHSNQARSEDLSLEPQADHVEDAPRTKTNFSQIAVDVARGQADTGHDGPDNIGYAWRSSPSGILGTKGAVRAHSRLEIERFGCVRECDLVPRQGQRLSRPDNVGKAAILEALNLLLSPEVGTRGLIDENDFYLRQYRLPPVQTMGTEAVEASACEGRHARFR
jgi:hypothetical protein